jgi:hypothetical protein
MRMRNLGAGLVADCKGRRVCDAGQCTGPAPSDASEAPGDTTRAPRVGAVPVDAPPAPEKATDPRPIPPPRERAMHARSTPLVVAGVVAVSLSSIGLYVTYGASIIAVFGNRDYYSRSEREDARNIAIGFGVGTALLIGAGIPMIVIGSKRVPDTEERDTAARPSNRAEAMLAPWAGPEGAGLRFGVTL